MDYIIGQNRGQITLLPDCIEDLICNDNPVRVIDAFVKLCLKLNLYEKELIAIDVPNSELLIAKATHITWTLSKGSYKESMII